jgi:hypothetical protein
MSRRNRLKRGHDGVDVASQRAAESAWTHLAFDGYSLCFDDRESLTPASPRGAATACATATVTCRWGSTRMCSW